MKRRERARCPSCGAIHRLKVEAMQLAGCDYDRDHRVVLICKWCVRNNTGKTISQYLERERCLGITLN